MKDKKLSPEQLLEKWNHYAVPKYQNPNVLALSAEYQEKRQWGHSLEMPSMMARDHRPHLIG